MSRQTPKFRNPNCGRNKGFKRTRLKKRTWRRPRGTGNKQRKKLKQTRPFPSIGYSRSKKDRGKHSSGLTEVIVCNADDLKGLNNVAVRISSKVGLRKRIELEKKVEQLKLKILNKTSDIRLKKLNKPNKLSRLN